MAFEQLIQNWKALPLYSIDFLDVLQLAENVISHCSECCDGLVLHRCRFGQDVAQIESSAQSQMWRRFRLSGSD